MHFLALVGMATFVIFGPHKMPKPWVDPGPDHFLWIQCPNCDARPKDAVVDTIVLHATVIPNLEETTEKFQNPEAKVSSHFTIGKDGSIIQNVSTYNRAWHCGPSKDIEGREHVNDFSIGIEMVNLNDGVDPYTSAQIQALKSLISSLKLRFPLKYITSHEYIALPKGRKSDPKGFPWEVLDDCGLQVVH